MVACHWMSETRNEQSMWKAGNSRRENKLQRACHVTRFRSQRHSKLQTQDAGSLLHLIQPSSRGREPLVLNQSLIHDPAEVGAVAAVAPTLDGLGDVADLHRLAGFLQHAFEGFEQALCVLGSGAVAATATPAAAAAARRAAEG